MNPSRESGVDHSQSARLSLTRLLDPDVMAQPSALYHAMRKHDPVHWDPYMHAWVVTGYSEVITVLTTYSSDRTPPLAYLDTLGLSFMKPFAEMMLKQMLFMDPPMHSRLRTLCSVAFTPRKVEELRNTIHLVADQLLDHLPDPHHFDLLEDFANPLPAIITSQLMGVPVEDHRQLTAWALDIAEVHGNFQHHPERVRRIMHSLEEMKAYVGDRIRELRAQPGDGLICSLINAEVDGERLTDDEVIATTIVTIIGGHETTSNLIASGFLALLQHPAVLAQWRSNPGMAAGGVEELLRYESPVQHTARIVPDDVELGGHSLRKGDKVVAVLAAANRDPHRFPQPDRLDLERVSNKHLAFGWGAHFCFGAPLTRMEGQIAFNTLLARLLKPVLRERSLEWRENAGLRGLKRLHIGCEGILPSGLSSSTPPAAPHPDTVQCPRRSQSHA